MSTTHVLTGAMQDGRFFTNYSPICQLNADISKSANLQSWNSTQYRDYLQKNGLSILKQKQNTCGSSKCSDNGLAVIEPVQSITPAYTDDAEL